MRKLFSFILIFSLIFSLSLPAFAEESEPSEPSASVSEPSEGGSDGGDTSTEPESSEPSEGGSGSSGGGSVTYSLNGATVNVSDESIQAIAEAVVLANSSYVTDFEYADGSYIPSVFATSLYTAVLKGGSYKVIYVSVNDVSSPPYVKYNSSEYYQTRYMTGAHQDYVFTGSKGYSSTDEVTYRTGSTSGTAVSTSIIDPIEWSNFDVYDQDGNLVHEADYEVAISYDITFDTGFDDLTLDTVSDKDFVAPELTYEGYHFDGWYLDKDFSMPYTIGYEFKSNTTLYAKWTPYRTVSFVTGIDDYVLDSIKVLSGEAFTPPLFAYSGYEFIGAYTDEDYENQFVGGTIVEDDLTLYLRFEPIIYDYGALMTEQLNRLEVFIYVQMATIIVFAVVLIGFFFFRKRGGLGV